MCLIKNERVYITVKVVKRKKKVRKNRVFAVLARLIINNIKFKGEFFMETITMQPDQFFEADIAFKNKKGNPANVEAGSVKLELRNVDTGEVVTGSNVTVTQGEGNESHIRIETSGDEVEATQAVNLFVKADADLENDQDDSTSDDVKEIEVQLATIVLQPLSAVGAGLANVSAVQDK